MANLLVCLYALMLFNAMRSWEIPDFNSYNILYDNLQSGTLGIFDTDPLFALYCKLFAYVGVDFELFWLLNLAGSFLIIVSFSIRAKSIIEKFFRTFTLLYITIVFTNGHIRFGLISLFLILIISNRNFKYKFFNYILFLSTLFHISFLIILILNNIKQLMFIFLIVLFLYFSDFGIKLTNMYMLYSDNANFILPTKGYLARLLFTAYFISISCKYKVLTDETILLKLRQLSIIILTLSLVFSLLGYITFADRVLTLSFIMIVAFLIKYFNSLSRNDGIHLTLVSLVCSSSWIYLSNYME
jgi:hypothetical protein